MKYWKDHFSTGYRDDTGALNVNASQTSEIVSILSAGTFFGALLSAPLADWLGRRMAMIFNSGVFTFGVILQTASTAIPMFVAGRFFAGLGVGLLSATIPLYQSETAPKWIRGSIVGCYQWAITIGLFLAAIVLNSTKNKSTTASYRIPIAVQFAWAIILVGGMLVLPETPRFLIKKGRQDKAAKALSRLRRLDVDHPALIEELAEIQANHEYEMSIGTASYLACFKAPIRKRLFTGMALQALQQLTGVNFIFYYGTSYVSKASLPPLDLTDPASKVPKFRHQQSIHHLSHHRRRQRLQHRSRPHPSREMGPSPTINVRRHRHGRMPAHRRLCWNRTTTQPHSQPNPHCIRESYPNHTTHLSTTTPLTSPRSASTSSSSPAPGAPAPGSSRARSSRSKPAPAVSP